MKSIIRYIVRNAKGEYQSAYSTKLGNKEAFKYAELTAKDVYGTIFSVDTEGNEMEVVSFPKPEPKKKNKKLAQKAA
tara:strand:- start:256 stop:486 length:231 start_codon:yes stop_codon:yes gene_type:complete